MVQAILFLFEVRDKQILLVSVEFLFGLSGWRMPVLISLLCVEFSMAFVTFSFFP